MARTKIFGSRYLYLFIEFKLISYKFISYPFNFVPPISDDTSIFIRFFSKLSASRNTALSHLSSRKLSATHFRQRIRIRNLQLSPLHVRKTVRGSRDRIHVDFQSHIESQKWTRVDEACNRARGFLKQKVAWLCLSGGKNMNAPRSFSFKPYEIPIHRDYNDRKSVNPLL